MSDRAKFELRITNGSKILLERYGELKHPLSYIISVAKSEKLPPFVVKQISALFFEAEKRVHSELLDKAESATYHIAGGDIDTAKSVWEDGLVDVTAEKTVGRRFFIQWKIFSYEDMSDILCPEGL